MTTPTSAPGETRKRYRPYVPENMEMPEFTLRAVLLGLVMTVILGAANAYLGLLFISLVRRVMVEDPELPFPESVAASEIHKAGQRGAQAAKYLFWNIGVGGVVYMLGRFGLFASDQDLHFAVGSLGRSQVRLGAAGSTN